MIADFTGGGNMIRLLGYIENPLIFSVVLGRKHLTELFVVVTIRSPWRLGRVHWKRERIHWKQGRIHSHCPICA